MPLGKTPILQNDLMAEGDNQKYLLFNDALLALEDSANRSLVVDMSVDNVALSQTQVTRHMLFKCEDHTVARILTIPISVGSPPISINRVLAVRNSGTAALTVTHNNAGNDIVIPAESTGLLYANGTDIISLGGVSNAATIPLNEDGVEVISGLLSLNIAGTGFTITDDGNGAATITFTVPASILDLGDTPADYIGQAGRILAVNATEDGVEFITNPGMTDAAVKTAYENNADTNAFTDAEKTKLTGIETGATADMTGAEIKAAYEAEANTNAFTDAEKSKLAGLEGQKFVGTYVTEAALISAQPLPAVGSYAYVDAGVGSDVTMYIWDDDDSAWVLSASGGGGTETAASIKTKYESNADTNAFTDAEKAKLGGVETGATADQTGAEIVAAIDAELAQTDWKTGGGGGSSLPTITTGDAGKVLAVNATEDGTEWVTPAAGAEAKPHRYWRVRGLTSAHSSFIGMADLQLRETVGGADIATEAFAIAGSSYGAGFEADKAFDADTATTFWVTDKVNAPDDSWVGQDFGAGNWKVIREIVITARTDSTAFNQTPSTFVVEFSDDNVVWTEIYAATAATWSSGASQTFVIPEDIAPSTLIALEDTPTTYGTAGQVLVVNPTLDGVEWADLPSTGIALSEDTAADHVVTDADLAGNVALKCNSASANTVTVNTGLIGTEPLTVVQTGVGQTSFVAGSGVTINSLNGNLSITGQFGSATLIPDGADNYILIGALS